MEHMTHLTERVYKRPAFAKPDKSIYCKMISNTTKHHKGSDQGWLVYKIAIQESLDSMIHATTSTTSKRDRKFESLKSFVC